MLSASLCVQECPASPTFCPFGGFLAVPRHPSHPLEFLVVVFLFGWFSRRVAEFVGNEGGVFRGSENGQPRSLLIFCFSQTSCYVLQPRSVSSYRSSGFPSDARVTSLPAFSAQRGAERLWGWGVINGGFYSVAPFGRVCFWRCTVLFLAWLTRFKSKALYLPHPNSFSRKLVCLVWFGSVLETLHRFWKLRGNVDSVHVWSAEHSELLGFGVGVGFGALGLWGCLGGGGLALLTG